MRQKSESVKDEGLSYKAKMQQKFKVNEITG